VKILAISDQVVQGIYSSHICERFGDVDMVLACGDLPYSYLEYIVTMLQAPCFFVHGNHDRPVHTADGRMLTQPGGWIDLDGRSLAAEEVLLAGLEGSIRYRPGAPFQYTDGEMTHRVWRLVPALMMNRVRYGRYLDILITHSPPFGIHDGQDLPHRGFKAFLGLMARFRPRYLLHGHKHVYGPQPPRTRYRDTEVINVYPFRVIEW
jgi:Icc-related predicted phosphoesterase